MWIPGSEFGRAALSARGDTACVTGPAKHMLNIIIAFSFFLKIESEFCIFRGAKTGIKAGLL